MLEAIAAGALVVIAVGVACFQVALAIGAPWGEWAFGGQHPGQLPTRYRVASGLSLIIYSTQILVYSQLAGFVPALLPASTTTWLSWIFVGFFALGTAMNAISRSKRERALWTPIVSFSLLCALVVVV